MVARETLFRLSLKTLSPCRFEANNPAHWPRVQAVCCESSDSCQSRTARKRCTMLWTIFVILLVLWLLGVVSSYTLGGFIHILLVIALVVLLIQLISGRRPVV
jgi:hypothetical protein